MRILHTSDWHLGRSFHGLHMTQEQKAVLDRLLDIIETRKTDVVIIAGDIYDRSVPPEEAVRLFDETLNSMITRLGQKVILIAGNHDNPGRLGFAQDLLRGQDVFITGPLAKDTDPVVLEDEHGPVYFAPLTYTDPLIAREIFRTEEKEETLNAETGTDTAATAEAPADGNSMTQPDLFAAAGTAPGGKEETAEESEKRAEEAPIRTHEDALRRQISLMEAKIPREARSVAIAHVFLTGGAASEDTERPLTMGNTGGVSKDLFRNFTYTALGHLHRPQKFGENIRYSGSLMKYAFSETDQRKGVYIIDLDADGIAGIETVPLEARHDLASVKGSFADLMENPREELKENFLEIILTDPTPILDAKNRLETIYPHIMHLQYERLNRAPEEESIRRERENLSDYALAASFFEQVGGQPLTENQERLLREAVEEVQKEDTP